MSSKWVYVAYGMIWVSMALAVSVGIYISGNWKCLFFMFIPSLISVKGSKDADND